MHYLFIAKQALTALYSIFRKYFPVAIALTCIVLSILVWREYKGTDEPDLWHGHWAGCGDFNAYSMHQNGNSDNLALEIKDRDLGKFVVSGDLVLGEKTYNRLFAKKASMTVYLKPLSSPTTGFGALFEQTFEIDTEHVDKIWGGQVRLKVKEAEIFASGVTTDFPYDSYRLGFSPEIKYVYENDSEYRSLDLDSAIVNIRLSNSLSIKKADIWNDFVTYVELSEDEKVRRYTDKECALVISRSPWFIKMISLLVLILCIPALCLLYRPDDNPGVELIAVILGVAAIRQFFLGTVVDWTLYQFDLVLAFIVVVTAIIPLFGLAKRTQRKRGLMRERRERRPR